MLQSANKITNDNHFYKIIRSHKKPFFLVIFGHTLTIYGDLYQCFESENQYDDPCGLAIQSVIGCSGTDLNDYGTIKVSIKITPDNIWLDVSAADRADLIHTICCKLHEEGKTSDFNALYADVIRRERLVSTFAGQDTAIPHVITPHINEPVLLFIRVSDPDFTWHGDSEKVRFVFFCAVPHSPEITSMREQQSQIFAGIAQLIHTPEITERWKTTVSANVVCNDLNSSFS